MKKILISLLVFMIVLAGFRIITNSTQKEVNEPVNTVDQTEQAENTTIPSFEPVVEKEEAYAPIEPDNTTGFQTSWYILNLDGNMEASATYDMQTLTVHHGGTAFNSNQLFRENAAFINGYEYEITFNASSNMDRDIELVIMNMDTSEVLASQIYSVTSDKQSYSLNFNMNSATSWNTRVEFNLGLPNSDVEHVVEISNIYVLNKTVVKSLPIEPKDVEPDKSLEEIDQEMVEEEDTFREEPEKEGSSESEQETSTAHSGKSLFSGMKRPQNN